MVSSQLRALEEGRAFAELTDWRTVAVRGGDARRWLHDLVTADVESLRPGSARRSLLLTPTGRIRADFSLAAGPDWFLLLQSPDQPESLDRILAPYVLSSDVEIEDRTRHLALFAVLGDTVAEDGAIVASPSALGEGWSLLVPAGLGARRLRERLVADGLVEASDESIEAWRILRGIPRMGADFGGDSLPAEAALEEAIDLTKGCFLGQESIAKVRNLGHPPRILRLVRSEGPVERGADVEAEGVPVGQVTSVAVVDGVTEAIVRVRWEARTQGLSVGGRPLSLR